MPTKHLEREERPVRFARDLSMLATAHGVQPEGVRAGLDNLLAGHLLYGRLAHRLISAADCKADGSLLPHAAALIRHPTVDGGLALHDDLANLFGRGSVHPDEAAAVEALRTFRSYLAPLALAHQRGEARPLWDAVEPWLRAGGVVARHRYSRTRAAAMLSALAGRDLVPALQYARGGDLSSALELWRLAVYHTLSPDEGRAAFAHAAVEMLEQDLNAPVSVRVQQTQAALTQHGYGGQR